MEINRAGQFLKQSTGYSSFKPCNLPPNPEIVYDAELMTLLSTADRLLGRLHFGFVKKGFYHNLFCI